ncbi:hypothetical protein [Henriciella sp.]|uniref:hypothetical protein n=1 Tax=Henriciella sp. TaxID=1968823 RepID=UPI0026189FC2|nr:hypothetical protein [Henriciella sp.]
MRDAVRTIIIAWVMLIGLSSAQTALAQDSDRSAGAERDRIERLVETHTDNDRLQTERPEWTPEIENQRSRDRNPIIEAIGDFFAWIFRTFGWVFKALLIGAVVCAIVYALWYMFGDVVGLRFQRKTKPEGPDISDIRDHRPDPKRAASLLEQADALAADGKFAEAVHLLLFRSIEDLRERRTGGVPQSLTAREISSLSDLTQRTRTALSPIIRVVENSFFGGRPVDRDGWQEARASYESFAFGEAPA